LLGNLDLQSSCEIGWDAHTQSISNECSSILSSHQDAEAFAQISTSLQLEEIYFVIEGRNASFHCAHAFNFRHVPVRPQVTSLVVRLSFFVGPRQFSGW
jgi:hypothetical protein